MTLSRISAIVESMDIPRPLPETRSAFLLPANVESSSKSAGATQTESGKPTIETKIEAARAQGREALAKGLAKVKEKMIALKAKIKALPREVARVAENAVIEAFTVPARIEGAVDTLNQKIDDAEAAIKAQVEAAKAKFEQRRQELIRRAQAAVEQAKERSRNFFGRLKESLFTSSRKREQEDLANMLLQVLLKAQEKGAPLSEKQFETIKDALVKVGERHQNNSAKINEFVQFYFKGARPALQAV